MSSHNDQAYWLRPWLTAIIAAVFLFPSIRTPGGLPSLRVEELLLVPFSLYCIMRAIKGGRVSFVWGARQTTLVLLLGFLFVSISSSLVIGYEASFGDLNQIIRYSKYVFVYSISVSYIYIGGEASKRRGELLDTFVFISVLGATIVVQQYFDLLGFNSLYVQYVAPTAYESLLGDYPFPRPVGMIGNPNEVGFAFVLGGLASSYRLIKKGGWVFLTATLVNLIAVGLTLSRTSLIALIAGGGYLYGMQLFVQGRSIGARLKYFALPVSALVAVIAYVLANPILYEAIGWRFYTLIEFQSTGSWQERLDTWQKNIELFLENPILGVGPLRRAEAVPEVADNEWLLLLRTYGILGTSVLVIGIIWPHLKARSGLLRVFISGMLISTAIYMIPAAVFHSLSLMPLLLILLATEDPTTRRFAIR